MATTKQTVVRVSDYLASKNGQVHDEVRIDAKIAARAAKKAAKNAVFFDEDTPKKTTMVNKADK